MIKIKLHRKEAKQNVARLPHLNIRDWVVNRCLASVTTWDFIIIHFMYSNIIKKERYQKELGRIMEKLKINGS